MTLRHDIIEDKFRFEDKYVKTKWYYRMEDALAEYNKIKIIPNVQVVTFSAWDYL